MNIFEIERRIDIKTEVLRLNRYIQKNYVGYKYRDLSRDFTRRDSFYNLIDTHILQTWEHRYTATNIAEYFESLGFDFEQIVSKNFTFDEIVYLYYFEFLLNMFYCQTLEDTKSEILLVNCNEIDVIHNNIRLTLDFCNYTYIKEDKKVILIKRNVDLDSILNIIIDKQINLDLLSYLDFRNTNNLIEKKSIIGRLYKYTDNPKHKIIKTSRIRLIKDEREVNTFDDFRFICEHFDVRHFPKELEKVSGIIELPNDETLELCDISYYMFLQTVRSPYIKDLSIKLNEYKMKYLGISKD